MKCLRKLWMLATVFSMASCGDGEVHAAEPVVDMAHRLSIEVGPQTITAVLYDNPTARDFISRLPLTADLSDYDGTEKVFTPSPGLTTQGSPAGLNPKTGDIALYAPWGNIAIYYKNGTSSDSLIPIGRIESGANTLNVPGTIRSVRFGLIRTEE